MSEAYNVYVVANGEVGYHEGQDADGSWNNQQKYSPAVPGLEWSQGMAWCQTFQAWIFQEAGLRDLAPITASCLTAVDFYRNTVGRWSWYPAVGAMVFYGDGGGSHTGFVYAYDADYIYTIEGNTNDDGSAEGDGVYRKVRLRRDAYTYGYGYPDYVEGITSADPDWGGTPEAHVEDLVAPAPEPEPEPTPITGPTYVIQDGDTLVSIADRAGITVKNLIDYNNWRLVTDGQTLVVNPEGSPEPEPDPQPSPSEPTGGRVPIDVSLVEYYNDPDQPYGEAAVENAIRNICSRMDIDPDPYWVSGYLTIASRESAYNHPNWRINTSDSNAWGPIVADGFPANCSRGVVQCIPPTFAENHEDGTSLNIYDMEANIAASMNYVMQRYGVSRDGHDLADLVQQADPNRPPAGY